MLRGGLRRPVRKLALAVRAADLRPSLSSRLAPVYSTAHEIYIDEYAGLLRDVGVTVHSPPSFVRQPRRARQASILYYRGGIAMADFAEAMETRLREKKARLEAWVELKLALPMATGWVLHPVLPSLRDIAPGADVGRGPWVPKSKSGSRAAR